jgi:hypothetical protein
MSKKKITKADVRKFVERRAKAVKEAKDTARINDKARRERDLARERKRGNLNKK